MSKQLPLERVLLLAAAIFFIFFPIQADEEMTDRQVIENTLKKIEEIKDFQTEFSEGKYKEVLNQ